jgi:hypothetical protein
MDPALMFGMVSEHDEEEDEAFDLSGWMSRSVPDLGSPMINEPTVRPRGGSAGPSDNVMASASIAAGPEPQFTSRPRNNPSNLGYTYESTRDEWYNPLYAHDDSRLFGVAGPSNPKAIVAIKVAGLAGMVLSTAVGLGGGKGPNKTVFTLSTLAVAHPTLGWNHGAFKRPEGSTFGVIFKNAGKAAVHLGALYGAYKIIRR